MALLLVCNSICHSFPTSGSRRKGGHLLLPGARDRVPAGAEGEPEEALQAALHAQQGGGLRHRQDGQRARRGRRGVHLGIQARIFL